MTTASMIGASSASWAWPAYSAGAAGIKSRLTLAAFKNQDSLKPREGRVLAARPFSPIHKRAFTSGGLMAKVPPWYSIRQRDRNVFHDNDQCPDVQGIEAKYRKNGHRCRMRCPRCAKLSDSLSSFERMARLTPL